MLCANCVVADILRGKDLPGLYRTHEEPAEVDLAAFREFVGTVVERPIDPRDRSQVQDLLRDVRDTNLSQAVNIELLRCMQRAMYSPRPSLHFALNFATYCHFTSPVRRYPDLVVHQVLDQHLGGEPGPEGDHGGWWAALPEIARRCSEARSR